MLLIIPPQAVPFLPHLALPQISGYLQKNGIDCKIVDLNILFYEYVFRIINKKNNDMLYKLIEDFRSENFFNYNKYQSSIAKLLALLREYKDPSLKFYTADYGIDTSSLKDVLEYIEFYAGEFNSFLDNYFTVIQRE